MSQYCKNNPCVLRIKERYSLSKPGSSKETFHITLDCENQSLPFKVGDAIAIFPKNALRDVDNILAKLRIDPQEKVFHPKHGYPLTVREFLAKHANLQKIRPSLLREIGQTQNNLLIKDLLAEENKSQLSNNLNHWSLIDWIEKSTMRVSSRELVQHLMPMLPRFYSIASSPVVYPEEIHLTVACFSYYVDGKMRRGLGSDFLCYETAIGDHVEAYIQPNHDFSLPSDPTKNIIMIGPGTGVAPYKGFIEERITQKSSGKNWLFFGERNCKFDFFYKDFFDQCIKENTLRLDSAFSRDQPEKIYVQHKLLENSATIYSWIKTGAYIYICGDAKQMAKDVCTALRQIICWENSCDEASAKEVLKKLKKEKRLLMDVY